MADLTEVTVSSVIMLLGVAAAVLGLSAETKRITADQVISSNGHCSYPSNSALVLGITAAFCLLLAQVVANVSGGCICCTEGPSGPYPSSSSKSIAILSLVLSWVTFFNAFVLLLAGASLQNRHQHDDSWFGGTCFVVKSGVFATGALLSLATACFGVVYFLAVRKVKRTVRWDEHLPAVAMQQLYVHQMAPIFMARDYQGQETDRCSIGGYPHYPPANPSAGYPVQSQAYASAVYNHSKG